MMKELPTSQLADENQKAEADHHQSKSLPDATSNRKSIAEVTSSVESKKTDVSSKLSDLQPSASVDELSDQAVINKEHATLFSPVITNSERDKKDTSGYQVSEPYLVQTTNTEIIVPDSDEVIVLDPDEVIVPDLVEKNNFNVLPRHDGNDCQKIDKIQTSQNRQPVTDDVVVPNSSGEIHIRKEGDKLMLPLIWNNPSNPLPGKSFLLFIPNGTDPSGIQHPIILPNDALLSNTNQVIDDNQNVPMVQVDANKSVKDKLDSDAVGESSSAPLLTIADTFSLSSSYWTESEKSEIVKVDHGKAPKKFWCDVCGKKFDKFHNFLRHRRIHSQAGRYECDICHKKLTASYALTEHYAIHKNVQAFKCGLCGRKFNLAYKLKEHMRNHTGERPYKCNVCSMSFTRNRNLASHRLKHLDKRIFCCDKCPKKFQTSVGLEKHKAVHDELKVKSAGSEKTFQCEHCDDRFHKKHHLDNHMIRHAYSALTENSPYSSFECDVCHEIISSERKFAKHIESHLYGKRFVCKMCGAKFLLKTNLDEHTLKVHNIVKPFKCKICDSSFRHAAKLRDHMWHHTGEKIHECSYCDAKLSTVNGRNKHERRHMKNNDVKKNV